MAGFSDGSGVQVRPEALDAEAGVFGAAAVAVESGAGRAGASFSAGAAGLGGGRIGAALHECAAAWAQCLAGLSAALDGDADNLRATAENYRTVDAGVARRLSDRILR
jgi:uncharacterized protein YukE